MKFYNEEKLFETPGVEMITGGILKASLGHFRTCHIKNGNKGDIAHTWGRGGSSSSFFSPNLCIC